MIEATTTRLSQRMAHTPTPARRLQSEAHSKVPMRHHQIQFLKRQSGGIIPAHRLYGSRKSTVAKAKIPIRINTTDTATTGVW